MNKVSIRFFNNHEVRAVWVEEKNSWYFSALDIIGAINAQDDYTKTRNYWKYLKAKLKKENNELVSVTTQLKLRAADGKMYCTDVFDANGVAMLAKSINSPKAMKFLDWLTYSENTIDGQSKRKAYTLFESNILETIQEGTVVGLQQIHSYLFGGLYDFAGKIRTKTISKGGFTFCPAQYLDHQLNEVEKMPESNVEEIFDKYIEMNVCHPFMEGNGRTTRIWLDLMLKAQQKKCIDWSLIDKKAYLDAMTHSVADSSAIKQLLRGALTDKISDREMFMKGIDYSYYYEEDDQQIIEEDKL